MALYKFSNSKVIKKITRGMNKKYFNFMKIKSYSSFINESVDEDPGNILLTYNGESPTTWYYVEDAIINGLLDEKLQLNEEIIEAFCLEKLYDELCTQQELADYLIQDFDNVLSRLLDYLKENEIIDEMPSSVEITGFDEDGEEYDLQWGI